MNEPYVICGLGNPGAEYDRTRHNVGFHLADALAERFGGRWTFPEPEFAASRAKIRGEDVLLIKPRTYMNLSGDALRTLGSRSPLSFRNLLVVCDDIALPAGQLRLRTKGSDGGQKGLRSIIDALGTSSFLRLRLGVGEPPEGVDASDYVLGVPVDDEATLIRKMVAQAVRCVEIWIGEGVGVAMSRFNRQPRERNEKGPESD